MHIATIPSSSCFFLSSNIPHPFLAIPAHHHHHAHPHQLQPWLVLHFRNISLRAKTRPTISCCQKKAEWRGGSLEQPSGRRLESILSVATSLYPLYMIVGCCVAILNPAAFNWLVRRAPSSYSFALASIMLATGLTLRLEDLLHVLLRRPHAVLFGFAAQYIIMPLLGTLISRILNLQPEISVGLILLACCPGGTASNVVTYIAKGDVPLSVLMTVCTTFAAVLMTPLLAQIFAGAYVPVNATALALSTLQVVFAPVIIGAWLQSSFPKAVTSIVPFLPLAAVLISSLLASSVFSANVGLLGLFVDAPPLSPTSDLLSLIGTSVGRIRSLPVTTLFHLGIITEAVLLLHAGGFLFGYFVPFVARFGESQRRAISIEVGMQNSSLGVVLASSHFSSPLTAVPAALSAVLMNIMGSALGVVWRHCSQADQEEFQPEDVIEHGSGAPI